MLLWFNDLEGHLKSFAITPDELEGALDDGMGFDGSSITGLQRDRGVGHGRDPRSRDVRRHAVALRRVEGRPDDLRRGHPRRQAVRGRPPLRLAHARSSGWRASASTPSTSGPSSSTSCSRTRTGTETLDEGGYFAMTTQDAATELRNETIQALEKVGIPIEYHHHEVGPSQHEIDMRFAQRARDGRPHAHLPADRQGDRGEERRLRDVHAEADLRRERLGDAHAPVALHGRAQRVLRRATTSGTSRTSGRRSSPASSATPARSRRSSPSG